MLHVACATEYFPLTLPLSLTERMPRILCAHCAPEPTPSPSQEGSGVGWLGQVHGQGTAGLWLVCDQWLSGKLRHGCDRETVDHPPSPQGRGTG